MPGVTYLSDWLLKLSYWLDDRRWVANMRRLRALRQRRG